MQSEFTTRNAARPSCAPPWIDSSKVPPPADSCRPYRCGQHRCRSCAGCPYRIAVIPTSGNAADRITHADLLPAWSPADRTSAFHCRPEAGRELPWAAYAIASGSGKAPRLAARPASRCVCGGLGTSQTRGPQAMFQRRKRCLGTPGAPVVPARSRIRSRDMRENALFPVALFPMPCPAATRLPQSLLVHGCPDARDTTLPCTTVPVIRVSRWARPA